MPTMIKPSATMTPPQSTRSAINWIARITTPRRAPNYITRSATSLASGPRAAPIRVKSATGMSPTRRTPASSSAGWRPRSTRTPRRSSPARRRTSYLTATTSAWISMPKECPAMKSLPANSPKCALTSTTSCPIRSTPIRPRSSRWSRSVRSTSRARPPASGGTTSAPSTRARSRCQAPPSATPSRWAPTGATRSGSATKA